MHKISIEPKKEDSYIILSSSLSVAPEIKIDQSLELQSKLQKARQTLGYQTAYFKETFSDELWQAMEHRGLSQAEFAKRAAVPKQFLTKVFRGGNCTMETIVKLAYALNYKAHVHLTPNDVGCDWIHWVPSKTIRVNNLNLLGLSAYENVKSVEKEVKYDPVASNS